MENDIRQIAKYETKCTGCGACVNVCPAGAIRLVERNGYFLFPEIDAGKCSHCGLCLKKCPSAGCRPQPSLRGKEIAFGCYVKDQVERERSSSGGVFQLLAKHVLREGGLVCGAKFTGGCHLEHVIIDREEDLPPLQRSKYLQSNPGNTYVEIRKAVCSGRKVLFVGTPCQVAGVRSVVGESDHLITADFCCHGNVPERLFVEHVDYLTEGKSATVTDLRFRDKEDEGWEVSHIRFKYAGGEYNARQIDDVYFKGFAECMTTRKSCSSCRFARFPRQGDFTLADCWDIAQQKLHWRDNRGVSSVILNTDKAKCLFKKIKSELLRVRRLSIDDISRSNNLETCWNTPHPNRQRFFDALFSKDRELTSDELIEKYLHQDDGICLLNFHDGHSNYGSLLTAYALQEKIKSIVGFSPVQAHLWSYDGGEADCGDIIDFNREYLPATDLIRSEFQLRNLNNYCRTYIVGPDVVWRNSGYTDDFDWFLFSFAPFSKNICSYAASFGYRELKDLRGEDGPIETPSRSEIEKRKRLMKRFSHISVREDSGVEICRANFDVEALHVLDAVFLLSPTNYCRIIETDSVPVTPYNVRYILNSKGAESSLIDHINSDPSFIALREGVEYSERNNVSEEEAKKTKGRRVGEWLGLIRSCDLFVTDSFHGVCFAIIFRRQFAVIPATQFASTERVDSLFRMLGIPRSRYVKTMRDYEYAVAHPIDYSKIEPRLNAWISKSEDYLRSVMADNKPNKTRDWIESVEMSVEDIKKSIPKRLMTKDRIVRVIRGAARRARSWGIISDEISFHSRTLGVFHVPILRINYSSTGRTVKFFGITVKRG